MINKKYTLFGIIILMTIMPLVSAELNTLGTIQTGTCMTVRQTCSSCTGVDLSISYPNQSMAVIDTAMTDEGAGLWTYDFCSTAQVGRYDVLGSGDLEGVDTSFESLYFEVKSYKDNITSQDNFPMYMLLVLALCIFCYLSISKLVGSMGIFILGFSLLFRESSIGYLAWIIIGIGFIMLIYALMASPKKGKGNRVRRFRR